MAFGGTVLAVLASVLAVALAVLLIMFVLVPLFKGIGWGIKQVFNFVVGEIGDALRIVGAVITNIVFIPLVIGSIVIGRWSAAAHFGRAIQSEFKTMGGCLYRIVIGHPARFLCLTALTDGLERRLPEVVAAAPGADKPSKARAGQFDGYRIVGSLPGGGSGGRLYVAEPDELKLASFARGGQHEVGQVVIKAFSLRDGSSLPQIVRESRALDAAKKLGLVLEHELTDERFFYVTRFVPGESLGLVTQRLHAQSPADGLGAAQLRQALGCGADLLRTLDTYHRGGLWHKDVKPDNIIVDRAAAHLVDFGLITPLRSAMTLTTHGTEYFRDPEMVRLALKGVKVHQVDGAKFDIYAAGAVLFSVIENSFPAHGGLSQVTKKCPEALRWIIRRAMTEYDRRYPSASMMLADLETVRVSPDPFAVKPAELPSMKQGEPLIIETLPQDAMAAVGVTPAAAAVGMAAMGAQGFAPPVGAGVGAPAGAGGPAGAAFGAGAPVPEPPRGRMRPRIRVAHWWTGRYDSDSAPAPETPVADRGRFVFSAGFRGGKPFVNLDRGEAGHAARTPEPPRGRYQWGADAGRDATVSALLSEVELAKARGDQASAKAIRAKLRREFGYFMTEEQGAPRDQARRAPAQHGRSAREQLDSARARVEAARERARHRMDSRRARQAQAGGQNFQAGFNPGVAAALFIFLGGCVAMVGGVMYMATDGFSKRVTEVEEGKVRASAHLALPLAPEAPAAPEAIAPEPPARRERDGHRPVRVELPSPAAAPVQGTLLIVSEVNPPYSSAATGRSIAAVVDRLASRGLTLIGNFPDNDASDEEIQAQNDLSAEVKKERGLAPLDSSETDATLGAWLADTEKADAIVWLEPCSDEPSGVMVYIFVPTFDPREQPKEAARAEQLKASIFRTVKPK